jgi:hypothetical protein
LAASLKNPKENLAKAQTYYAKAATFAFAWQAVLGENLRPGRSRSAECQIAEEQFPAIKR